MSAVLFADGDADSSFCNGSNDEGEGNREVSEEKIRAEGSSPGTKTTGVRWFGSEGTPRAEGSSWREREEQ